MLNASASRLARLWLLLGLTVCLGAIPACGIVGRDSSLHPLNTYDVQIVIEPTNSSFISIQIDLFYQGQDHWLASGESIVCDGVNLTSFPDSSTLYASIPPRNVGATYQCIFSSQGQSVTMVIPVVPPPTLITPAAQAILALAGNFTITYAPLAHGQSIADVTVGAHFADPSLYHDFTAQQTGPETFVVDPHDDLRNFVTGLGSLDISALLTTKITPTGGVHSLTATFSMTTTLPITWT